MSKWQHHAEAALVDITSALTGKPDDARQALDDALENLNRAIGELDYSGTSEEVDDDDA